MNKFKVGDLIVIKEIVDISIFPGSKIVYEKCVGHVFKILNVSKLGCVPIQAYCDELKFTGNFSLEEIIPFNKMKKTKKIGSQI